MQPKAAAGPRKIIVAGWHADEVSDLVSAVAAFAAPDTQVTALCTSTPQLTKEDCRGCKVDVQVGPGTWAPVMCLMWPC